MVENKIKSETRNLTDKDFYQQACSYFYYHAEQRTNMINYFTAVFGAGAALYGSLILKQPVACVLISTFLLGISFLFYFIDLRTRFDVKHSQSVIAQIEKDYYMDLLRDDNAQYVYGVFSNEDNTFKYYNTGKRRHNKEYKRLRKMYKQIKRKVLMGANDDYIKALNERFNAEVDKYLKGDDTISKDEFIESMDNRSIISLSTSIKWMYWLCIGVSLIGVWHSMRVSGLWAKVIAFVISVFC